MCHGPTPGCATILANWATRPVAGAAASCRPLDKSRPESPGRELEESTDGKLLEHHLGRGLELPVCRVPVCALLHPDGPVPGCRAQRLVEGALDHLPDLRAVPDGPGVHHRPRSRHGASGRVPPTSRRAGPRTSTSSRSPGPPAAAGRRPITSPTRRRCWTTARSTRPSSTSSRPRLWPDQQVQRQQPGRGIDPRSGCCCGLRPGSAQPRWPSSIRDSRSRACSAVRGWHSTS